MREPRLDSKLETSENLKERIIAKFPLAGAFIYEDLEADSKRAVFLDNEALREAREAAIANVVERYLPEDTEFMADMSEGDKLGYIYGALLEMGEDPDKVLKECGVMEESDEV